MWNVQHRILFTMIWLLFSFLSRNFVRKVLISSRNHWEILLLFFFWLLWGRQTRVAHHIYFLSLISSLTILLYFYLKYFFYNETFSSLFQHMQPIIMVSVRFLFIIFKVLVSKSFVAIINKKMFPNFFSSSNKIIFCYFISI